MLKKLLKISLVACSLILFSSSLGKKENKEKKSAKNSVKTHTISQKDKKFSQQKITVKLGDHIEFKNDEKSIVHNVYSITPGNLFEIQTQKPGHSSVVKLDPKKHKPGNMKVECAIHPNMKLDVTITK